MQVNETALYPPITNHAPALPRVVLLLQFNLNLIADRLYLPPLPLSAPDQIPKSTIAQGLGSAALKAQKVPW